MELANITGRTRNVNGFNLRALSDLETLSQKAQVLSNVYKLYSEQFK